MKYVDVSVQTLVILFSLIILMFSFGKQDLVMSILFAQFLLGAWQLLSSVVSVLVKVPFQVAKRWHLLTSITYLLVLYATRNESVLMIIVPSWILAFYYYFITWKWVLYKVKKRSRFLPNLGF